MAVDAVRLAGIRGRESAPAQKILHASDNLKMIWVYAVSPNAPALQNMVKLKAARDVANQDGIYEAMRHPLFPMIFVGYTVPGAVNGASPLPTPARRRIAYLLGEPCR